MPLRHHAPAALLLLLACTGGRENAGSSDFVELHVDRELISGGDPSAVMEPVWWSTNIYGSLEDYEASLARFSREQRLIVALQWYIAEVNNGGHEQFYSNSTGIVWPDAAAAFEAIGVRQGAEIIGQSAARLGGAPSRDRDERQSQLESTNADFSDLDDRFYRLQDEVDLDAAMLRFIRANPERFLFSGTVERPAQ
jgi:hypothetical protein